MSVQINYSIITIGDNMKKGFTLIELLAVIVIIALIGAITMPIITKVIQNNQNKAYQIQVSKIEDAARAWSTQNISLIEKDSNNYVELATLINQGYIDQNEVINPKTKLAMTGCVQISYIKMYNQYEYRYGDYQECN